MMTLVPDRAELMRVLERESARVAGLARGAHDMNAPVPGLAWTVGELASHLGYVYQSFATAVRDEPQLPGYEEAAAYGATMPASLAAANEVGIAQLKLADAAQAAETLEAAAGDLLDALAANRDWQAFRPARWYGPTTTRTVGALAAVAASESLVHGVDLARALKADARMPRESAAVVAPIVMSEMLPILVDEERTREFVGSYEVRVRGGRSFIIHVAHGKAWTTSSDTHDADCVLSLDPRVALLLGFARVPRWRAVLGGGVVAFGRKPWLGARFNALFHNP